MRALGPLFAGAMLVPLALVAWRDLPPPARPAPIERAVANDNRRAAGTLRRGTLTLRLEARIAMWHPDGDANPGVPMLAFAEVGKPAQIPGPLVRVPAGTEIRASLRNPFPGETLSVRGLHTRGDVPEELIEVLPGATRELRFVAGAPGTYYYWGTTSRSARVQFDTAGKQAVAAFVVDPAGVAPRADRILVLGGWVEALDSARRFAGAVVWSVNGRSWPHTERLDYAVGDSVRLRVINASPAVHPMHLHGFYFRVDSRGDARRDTSYAPDERRLAFTERMVGGSTASITWVPERVGGWIMHCHIVAHFSPRGLLGTGRGVVVDSVVPHHRNHAEEGMSGLVMGFRISPRGAGRDVIVAGSPARRRLRLEVREDSGGSAREPAFSYALSGAGIEGTIAPSLPGPPIVLRRGEPVSIMVVNRLAEPTAVHWHGIELESYFDGVAGFGGSPGRLTPPVGARDSFEVRFTPPRAGTFIYHTHAHELRQLRGGLSGALLVVEPDRPHDPASEATLIVTTPRRIADAGRVLINGSQDPAPLRWRAGTALRLRLINIHIARPNIRLSVLGDSTPLTWRALAKDAVDLPPRHAVSGPAVQTVSVGETYDFALTPPAAGPLRIEVRSQANVLLATQRVIVE